MTSELSLILSEKGARTSPRTKSEFELSIQNLTLLTALRDQVEPFIAGLHAKNAMGLENEILSCIAEHRIDLRPVLTGIKARPGRFSVETINFLPHDFATVAFVKR